MFGLRTRRTIKNQPVKQLSRRWTPVMERLEDRTVPATHVWQGPASGGFWSNAANWTNGLPTSNEAGGTIVQFNGGITSTMDIVGLEVDQINFTAGSNTILGNTTLTLDGSVLAVNVQGVGNNSLDSSLPINLVNVAPGVSTAAGGTLFFSGVISGNQGFAVLPSNGGDIQLGGSNTFTGQANVQGGRLLATNSDSLGTTGTETVVTANGTLFFANVTTAEPLIIQGGTVTTNNGLTPTLSGNINLAAGTSNFDIPSGATMTLSGVISGANNLRKTNTGALTFSGAGSNTYTGATFINDGTLNLSKVGAIAITGNNGLQIGDGVGAANSAVVAETQNNNIADGSPINMGPDGRFVQNAGVTDTISFLGLLSGASVAGAGLTVSPNGLLLQGFSNTNNTLTIQSYSGPFAADFDGQSIIVLAPNTVTYDGQNGSDTLVDGTNSNLTYNITGFNAGNVGGTNLTFTNVENLTGGTGTDIFAFPNSFNLSGTINGGGGNDTLSGINGLTTLSSFFGGTQSGTGPIFFTNIEQLIGGGFDTLQASAPFTYNVTGANAGSISGGLSFTGYSNIFAGVSNDIFNLTTGTLSGTANGGPASDQFNVTPSAAAVWNVNGGNPAGETNTATFDLAGVTNPILTPTGPNSFTASFGNRQSVFLTNIQFINAINGNFGAVINGTNQNDVFTISRNGANLVITISTNGNPATTIFNGPAGTLDPITFNGLDGNDQLIVDESGGTVTNTLNFNGGNPVFPTTPGDSVLYTGGSFANLVYNATGIGAGNINLDGNLLNFTSTEPITVLSALGNVTINLVDNAANHTITLGDDGTLANNLSQVTIDGGIESLTFTNPTNTLAFAGNANFSNVVILNALDTASLTPNINLVGGNVSDEFRITSLRFGQSVNILANAGTDSVVVGGSTLATFNTGATANLANILGTVNVLANSTSTVYIDDTSFAGGRTINSNNIASMPFFFTQGVQTTVNGLTTSINVNNGAREVQTASGGGNDTFRINTTLVSNYSSGTTQTFFGNFGNDNFFVRPSTAAGINVFGGSPSIGDPGVPPNGDRLVVFAYGATVNPLFSPDGFVSAPGFVPVTFNNIEFVSVPDRFEINDTPSQATFLGSDPFVTLRDLSIHAVDDPSTPLVNEADIDYFRYVAHDTGYLTINAQYLSIVGGQLVVEVYRPTSLANLIGPNVPGAPFNNTANYVTSVPGAVGTIDGTTLNIPVVKGQIYYIKVRGVNQQQDAGNYNLEIENFAAAVPTVVNLPANLPGSVIGTNDNDTGRSNTDGITNNSTPYFIIQADLRDLANAGITMLTAAQATAGQTAGASVQVYVRTFAGVPITSFFAEPVAGSNNTLWSVRTTALPDGNYQVTASTVIFDNNSPNGLAAEVKRSGVTQFGSPPLNFTIDTTAPASPSFVLNPLDDTGIPGQPNTYVDRITKNPGANFTGNAEAAAWMQFYAVDRNAIPQFGGTAYANAFGQYFIDPTFSLNDPTFFDQDGERLMFSTATDVAGNVSAPQTLLIFLDTRGPQVAGVTYRYDLNGNPVVIDLLNQTLDGQKVALPQINYIDVTLIDQPNRTDNFIYPAANELLATTPGNFAIIGKRTGNQTIQSVGVLQDDTISGGPGLTTYRLFLSKPLPDDKFTFKVFDRIQDEAGNALDGDFQPPTLPSGDGVPGDNFVIQFLTVDSRAELGFYANGAANLDLNGDFIVNPGSNVGDDAITAYAPNGGAVFSGQFYDPAVGTVDGFDRLGTYGKQGTRYVFRLDFNNDGDFTDAGETTIQTSLQINGMPIAGNWGPSAVNLVSGRLTGSNVGVFDGTTWYLDVNGNNIIESAAAGDRVLRGNMRGLPFTGDFDGDGITDLGTYLNGVFYLDLSVNDAGGLVTGFTNYTFRAALPLQTSGTASRLARPVAADFDGDGITDIGLFFPNQTTVPAGQANWFLMNSNGTPWDIAVPSGSVRGFKNVATGFGNDIAATYGSARALPVVGNFDPNQNLKPAAASAAKAAAQSAAANLAHNLADLYFESTDRTDFFFRGLRKGKGR